MAGMRLLLLFAQTAAAYCNPLTADGCLIF
jgi:hypothetical protein